MDIMLSVKTRRMSWAYSENVALVVEEKMLRILLTISTILCSTISLNTNQEADHLANLGAEGVRKIIVEKGNKTENLKAVRGFWDGSKKTDGRSGCGVVIKGVDRDKWSRCGGCWCSDWNLGLGVGKNHQ